jgi:hypothetical protein
MYASGQEYRNVKRPRSISVDFGHRDRVVSTKTGTGNACAERLKITVQTKNGNLESASV